MNMYIGDVIDPIETCDWQAAKCNYYVKEESFDLATCNPIIMFDNATVNGTDFLAGGKDYLFSVAVPITDGALLMVTAYMARIEGTVILDGDTIIGMEDAIVGGAVPKALIMEAVDNLPEDLDLPVSKDLIKSMLDLFIVPDVSTNGDPELDGASVGIQFSAIEGAITSMEPADAE